MILNFVYLKKIDWLLIAAVILLVCVGLTVIYSVTLSQTTPDNSLLWKQVTFFLLGLVFMLFFIFFDYRVLGAVNWLVYFLALALLVAVLFLGTNIRGTRGWFQFFGFSFQPVEIVKLALVVFLAKYFANKVEVNLSLKYIVSSFFLILVPVVLVAVQPDFGSALVLLACWLSLVWLAGLRLKHLLVILLILLLVFVLSWLWVMQDYQKERVLNFINPGRDPLGQGYNVRQSVIAVGSGGWLGRGLGLGPQSQLKFLPETEADFIFASLAEELGFAGGVLVLGLYLFLFWRIYKIVKTARDNFSQLLVMGIATVFFVHILINIGMALGLLPVTGLPLPLISSGGSFLITNLATIGILESVVVRNKGVA